MNNLDKIVFNCFLKYFLKFLVAWTFLHKMAIQNFMRVFVEILFFKKRSTFTMQPYFTMQCCLFCFQAYIDNVDNLMVMWYVHIVHISFFNKYVKENVVTSCFGIFRICSYCWSKNFRQKTSRRMKYSSNLDIVFCPYYSKIKICVCFREKKTIPRWRESSILSGREKNWTKLLKKRLVSELIAKAVHIVHIFTLAMFEISCIEIF